MIAAGLEGVVAAETAISSIVEGQLLYQGIPVEAAAQEGTFAEVAWLLWTGELPSTVALTDLETRLAAAWEAPREVHARLRGLPPDTPMLVALREGVAVLAALEDEPPPDPDAALGAAIRLVGALPAIAAQWYHIAGGRPHFAPRVSGSLAARFLHAVRGEPPSHREARALDQALILYADHELNASTFTARVVASTRADLYSAVIAALCTLKGPLHGGAMAEVWRFLHAINNPTEAARAVDIELRAGRRIPGFGHRVYQGPDPRGVIFREMARRLGGEGDRLAVADAVAKAVETRLGLYANVDFYGSVALERLGLGLELASAVFALGRMAGWTAHILEQYANNKLIRPRARYVGPPAGRWTALSERAS